MPPTGRLFPAKGFDGDTGRHDKQRHQDEHGNHIPARPVPQISEYRDNVGQRQEFGRAALPQASACEVAPRLRGRA